MKYKILKGTELFNKLTGLKKRMEVADKEAKDLAISLGGHGVATLGRTLAGGIDAIGFKERPDKGLWIMQGKSWQMMFFPRSCSANKEVLKKITDLPKIKFEELNQIIGYGNRMDLVASGGGIAIVKSVGMAWYKNFILMETADGVKYKPLSGIEEILGSEYDFLMKKIKD